MRICLVNALFHPFQGGIEKHIYELSRGLIRHGVDVTVVTSKITGTPAYEEIDGVRIHRVPCIEFKVPGLYPPPWIFSPLFLYHLSQIDRLYDFDIIHLHNRFFPDFLWAGVYARLKNKLFMMTIHNSRPVGVSLPVAFLGTFYDLFVGRLPFVMADRIISVSDWSKWDISKYFIDVEKMTTVHNGIDTGAYCNADGNCIRKSMGVGDNPLILYVGRLVVQKGVDYLIEALPEVIRKHPRAMLLIAGSGNRMELLKQKTAEMGIEGHVHFTSTVSEDLLRQIYMACDIFVLPSITEPFGMVAIEAMACGKPVICTDSGGVTEIVRDGYNGFVVPIGDPGAISRHINMLLSDPSMKSRMGSNGIDLARSEFDIDVMVSRTKTVYDELYADAGRKRSP